VLDTQKNIPHNGGQERNRQQRKYTEKKKKNKCQKKKNILFNFPGGDVETRPSIRPVRREKGKRARLSSCREGKTGKWENKEKGRTSSVTWRGGAMPAIVGKAGRMTLQRHSFAYTGCKKQEEGKATEL